MFCLPPGGADLVSCGGSGVVRLWSTARSRLVGQFTAHHRDLGSIVMTVSPCGKYLVTADREGTLKTWDIQVGFFFLCRAHMHYRLSSSGPHECTLQLHLSMTFENKRPSDKYRESDGER